MQGSPYKASWTLAIDTREQLPWLFEGLTKHSDKRDMPLVVAVERKTLPTGDYSIVGHEDRVCIERKSPSDLIQTVVRGRDRFERELERMQEMEFSAVIVEGEWAETMKACRDTTNFNPSSLDSSILAWQQRFNGTHWYWRPGRFNAMKTAYKILDRWNRDWEKQQSWGSSYHK